MKSMHLHQIPSYAAPLLSIQSISSNPVIMAKDYALTAWKNTSIPVSDWDIEILKQSDKSPENPFVQLLRNNAIDTVITSTSDVDDDTDCRLWLAAKQLGLETWCVVDHRVNMASRFSLGQDTVVFPDHIIFFFKELSAELIALGAAPESLHLMPDLHLEDLSRLKVDIQEARIQELRFLWGARESDRVLLFPSENTREMVKCGRKSPYDEIEQLSNVILTLRHGRSVGALSANSPERTILVIRPHPKDTPGKYKNFTDTPDLRVIVSTDGTPLEAIFAADAILGIDSSMLFEAHTLGRPTYSCFHDSSFQKYMDSMS